MQLRYGRFTVTTHLIEDHPEEFSAILAQMQFIPMKVERLYSNYGFEYIGYSPMFEEIAEGMICPEYEMVLEKDENGDVRLKSVEVVRHSMLN